MNIQAGINQTISIAGLLFTQSGGYKAMAANRAFAKAAKGKEKEALYGLEDLEKNVERAELTRKIDSLDREDVEATTLDDYKRLRELGGRKTYNQREFEDIKNRALEYNKNVYDAKVARNNPNYSRYMNKDMISQPELSSKVDKIIAYSDKAIKSIEARQMEQEASRNFIRSMGGN